MIDSRILANAVVDDTQLETHSAARRGHHQSHAPGPEVGARHCGAALKTRAPPGNRRALDACMIVSLLRDEHPFDERTAVDSELVEVDA